ncbi:MAG: type II secretion system protein [Candidatus Levybacteria bacterium]|nr:type II secretion system protein [Candidatus Levybacteria bacterium]
MLLPNLKNQKGFTLIELLTVISIISILTALLAVSFGTASQRGRDGQRKSNIRQIQAALELFRADNDSYPPAATYTVGTTTSVSVACNAVFTFNSITYMQKMPCDPESGTKYFYLPTPTNCSPTGSPCIGYTLASCIDNTADKEATTTRPSTSMTACSPGYYFVATNP